MIPNGKGCHYLAVKKLLALLVGITSKHQDDFYCQNWIVFIPLKQKTNLNSIKKYVKVKIFAILCCLLKKLKY